MPIFVVGEGIGLNQSGLFLPMQTDVAWLRSAVMGALELLTHAEYWREEGDVAVSYAVEACSQMFSEYQFVLNPSPVGMIAIWPTYATPNGWIGCDGLMYPKSAYPLLYDVLGGFYGEDEDNFMTPPLWDRFPLNVGYYTNPGEMGGEMTHTLTTDEIPSHTHTIPLTSTTLFVAPGEVPGSIPVAILTDNTGATGGGAAHNNMPPYLIVQYMIYAGQ